MKYQLLFKMPTPVKITGRSSSITNSFINSIIPVIPPTSEQIEEALSILGMGLDTCQCSYCGSSASEWDHLRPLVVDQKPTGYISEIQNLVPSCGKCNQSKGNKHWEAWMRSNAALSPKVRGVTDIEERIARLKKYEQWGTPTLVDFEAVVGKQLWETHWSNWKVVLTTMRNAQETADQIKSIIAQNRERL